MCLVALVRSHLQHFGAIEQCGGDARAHATVDGAAATFQLQHRTTAASAIAARRPLRLPPAALRALGNACHHR